jgi:hypothetical protein
MARKPPIKRTDHQKNKEKKTGSSGERSQKKDDDTFGSTEPSTVTKKDVEEEEKETMKEMDDTHAASKDNVTPEDMIVTIRMKDGDTETSSLAVAAEHKRTSVAKDGKLTVIQKSKLMNWAEEHFLCSNKIMTFEEAARDVKLHKAASNAMELENGDWAIVGSEAIKKLRSAMSDRLCLHRKVVKGMYMGKYFWGKIWIALNKILIHFLKYLWVSS